MKRRTKQLLSMLCVLTLLLGLLPLGAQASFVEEAFATEETPLGEEALAQGVGTMPGAGFAAAELPEEVPEDPGADADLSAANPSHLWTADDPSDTFFAVACAIQGGAGDTVQHPVTGFKWTKADGTQQTLTTVKSAKLSNKSSADITFSVPQGQEGTFYMILTSRGSAKEADFKMDGSVVKLNGTPTPSFYSTRLTGGNHSVARGNKEADIHMLLWEPDCAHDWGTGTVTTPATCTAKGVRTYTCSLCGSTKTEEIDLLPHTEKTIPQKDPTCKDVGKAAEVVCAVCGKHISGGEVIPVTKDHKLDANFKCTVCGKQLADPGHTCDWDRTKGKVLKAATCTEDGSMEYPCKVANCDKTLVETQTKLGHALVQHNAQAATCTEAGWEAYEDCSRCDYTTKKVIPAKGHKTGPDGVCTVCGQLVSKPMTNAGGWFETLYGVLPGVTDAEVTGVTYTGTMNGRLTGEDLEYLVRDTADGVRVDIPGLAPGTYTLRVTTGDVTYEAKDLEVLEYDRSGYAHWNYTEGVGAYRDDGILKDNAIVLYVTEENKNTVTLEAPDGTTVTGIGNILNTSGQESSESPGMCKRTSEGKTYWGKANSNQGILKKLADADIPLVIRIVGDVKSTHPAPASGGIDGLTAYNAWDYGGTYKSGDGDNGNMARMKDCKDITIEGIGPDACANGWGFHFMTSSTTPDYGKNFEVRNLAFRNVPEDCIGMEGVQSGSTITAPILHGWVHNCSFYAPSGLSPAAASDKDGGDGACDFKRGEYFTMDYCYYDGYHKTNLVGSSDSSLQYHITWHHNYWKNCDSRGPLGRQANMHIYNCIYDGQMTYAQNVRANCYIFSEYNAFYSCKGPRTFKTGTIKSYKDVLSSCIGDEADKVNTVTDRNEKVGGANKYKDFDTDATISYIPSGNYKLDTDHAAAKAKILAYAGPMKTQIVAPEDVNGSTVEPDRTPAASVVLPYDQAINSGYISASGVKDNIVFTLSSVNGTAVKYGKDSVGQYVVFKVDEPFDVTLDGAASVLVNSSGNTVADVPGSASNLPAGIYYVQSNSIQPAKGDTPMYYKDGSLSHLTITKSTSSTPPHVCSFSGWKQTVAPTCIREGVELGTCSCGATQSRPIAKTAHNYVNGECTVCHVSEGTFGGDPDLPEVAVDGLELSHTSVYLLQGKTERVIATVSPSNATNKYVTWTSDDEGVATVAKNGTITGKGPGQTTVTAQAGGFTQTVDVTVVAVSSNTYTFAATEHGPATVADKSKGEDPVADGSKWGKGSYFTSHGAGNKWKAKDYSKGNMATTALLLAAQATSSLDFTVPEGATAKVTLNFCSTSGSNTSAIAILDAEGSLADGQINVANGTGTQSATYELGEGTYRIVAPANVEPGDVNDTWDVFPADANNPNKRGTWLIRAEVLEEKVASGDFVAVTGISLNKTTATLQVGQTGALIATVTPSNATNQNVSWTTSNAAVASVSQGTVTARGVGAATITATCGGKKATCEVTVTASSGGDGVKVTSLTITDQDGKTEGAVTVDGTQAIELQLFRSAQPEDADNKDVTWSSDRVSQGVSVDQNGLVTVAEDAQACVATITATAQDGSGVKDTYTLSVLLVARVEITDVVIRKDGAAASVGAVQMGHELRLTGEAQVKSIGGGAITDADKAVTWRSTDEKVATVKDGVVTPVGVGTAGIIATSVRDTTKFATLELTVAKGQVKLAIQARNEGVTSDGGTILLRVDGIPAGVDASVTILPEDVGTKIEPCDENGWNYKVTLPANPSETEDVAYVVTADFGGDTNWSRAEEAVSATLYVRHVGARVITVTKWPAGGLAQLSLKAGDKLELSVEATVAPDGVLTYHWFKDGVLLDGADTATYTKEAVTAADAGEYICRISCEGAADNRDAKVTVTVDATGNIAVESVSLDRATATITAGRTMTLTATVKPDNATVKTVKWSSSNDKVATVSDAGVVTGVTTGTATITAATLDGAKSATCNVTVIAGGGGGGGSTGGGGGSTGGGGGGGSAKPVTPATDPTLPFIDVAPTSWFHNTVKRAFQLGLMKGTDGTHFAPNATTTRAMVATVLYRLDGEKTSDVKALFTDVASGQWYTQAIAWAAGRGVVKGYDANTFAPDDNVTREQLAVMLYRYAAPADKAEKDLGAFADAASVSDWAVDAMTWAVDKGIITGKSGSLLDPQGLASRAEICTMLVRYLDLEA